MKKKLLLIGYNFAPEPTGIGKYSGEMIRWLAEHGIDCSVITTYPYYPFWKVQEPYRKNRFWYKKELGKFKGDGRIFVYRCPIYVPSKPSTIRRIFQDLSFFISAFFRLLILLPRKKFDFVITIAPSFQIGLLGVFYKKFRQTKHIHHLQDMQIEAARDLKMIKSPKLIELLFSVEKYIFNHADVVSSISESMVAKIKEKANKEVYLFPNWADTRMFYPLNNQNELKKEFGFNPANKIILYSGAIGEKQGLESILYTAQEFKNFPILKFVICGSGPYKSKLENLAVSLQLQNVIFFDLQPLEKFNHFLNMVDLHLVIQKANASDLVLPSKLTNILAVGGVPLITANKGSGLHTLIERHKMGFLVKAEDQQALNAGIQKSIMNGNEHIRRNARIYAENYLSINKVMGNLESLLTRLNNSVQVSNFNQS